jgi:hypothetical protein
LTIVKAGLRVGYQAISMRHFFLWLLTALFAATVYAQTGCPAHGKAIPFHNVNRNEMIVGVSINHSGPYEFLFDTGTQVTVVDRELAEELHLSTMGNAPVAGVSFQGAARFAQLDKLQLGDHAADNQDVLVYDMKKLQAQGYAIRGLLGEDFLSRYDVLIDNAHKVLCLDDTGRMRNGMNAEPAALISRREVPGPK